MPPRVGINYSEKVKIVFFGVEGSP